MGEAALQQERTEKNLPSLQVLEGKRAQNASNSILTIAVILIILQILDGVLTGYGMKLDGIGREGNPLLRALMEQIGYVNALIITKGLAIAIICTLVRFADEIKWLKGAMTGVAFLYLGAAIIPWSIILAQKVLL